MRSSVFAILRYVMISLCSIMFLDDIIVLTLKICFMEKLTKRKNARSKGNAQLKPRRRTEEQEVAYILTDVKETVVTEILPTNSC